MTLCWAALDAEVQIFPLALRWAAMDVGVKGMDWPGVCQVPEHSGEQGKREEIGCKIICGAPKTLAVKRLMMIMSLCIRGAGNFLPDFAVRDAIKFSGIQDCGPQRVRYVCPCLNNVGFGHVPVLSCFCFKPSQGAPLGPGGQPEPASPFSPLAPVSPTQGKQCVEEEEDEKDKEDEEDQPHALSGEKYQSGYSFGGGISVRTIIWSGISIGILIWREISIRVFTWRRNINQDAHLEMCQSGCSFTGGIYLFNSCIVQMGKSGCLPRENKLRQNRATQPTVHAGYFSVSIIHRILTWTTGSLTCVQM